MSSAMGTSGKGPLITRLSLWFAILLAGGYAWVLKTWYYQMVATHASGIDPFQSTSLMPCVVFSVLYLVFIKAGPMAMASRKEEFDVKPFMLIYNTYQVLINIFCVVGFLAEVAGYGHSKGMTFWGNEYDRSRAGVLLGFYIWVHYNNKFVELLDTVWMVLRKKDRQVSVLHVFHHLLMMWAWVYVCKLECGGDAWFGAFCNSLVHVFMYTYYALAQLGVSCPWKIYLTKLQLLQFVICMIHSGYVLYKGNMPPGLPLVQAFVMMSMLVLFTQFYMKTYAKKGAAAKKSS